VRTLDPQRALKDVGRRIAELRRERGWTQEVFAARLGIQPNSLQRIETGRQNVTVHTLVRFGNGLGVPLAALFETPSDRTVRTGRPRSERA